jgi:excisionase family DNA binding protein
MGRKVGSRRSSGAGDPPRYYTTHQVARLMGVSIPTVVNWCDSGRLHAHRTAGGHRRIPRQDLLDFAQDRGVRLDEAESAIARADDRDTDRPWRVLIVDDEQDFSEMLKDYLEIKGFAVEVAESGFVAGLTVARFDPDIILMDIMMPDMDGFEVHRRLREDAATRHIPVVACTAYRDPSLDARVARERFEGFVEKPLKMSSLVDLLQRTLDRPNRG